MKKSNYEIVQIDKSNVVVDVSQLQKFEQMFFNATEMAKPFGRLPAQWLRLPETESYIVALLNVGLSHIKNKTDLIKTRRGRRLGGTWLHQDLGLAFARWLSPVFAVRLDMWTKERLRQESNFRNSRLEAKTSYLPMTQAIADSREEAKPYHFSNENNLLYSIILGMRAKEYREQYGVESIRDHLSSDQLKSLSDLQQINTGLLRINIPYSIRKVILTAHHEGRELPYLLEAV